MIRSNVSRRHAADLFLVFTFFAVLWAPTLCPLCGIAGPDSSRENRSPTPWPRFAWSVGALKAFSAAFADYYRDHYGLRSTLISSLSVVRLDWLGTSPVPKVIPGACGWYFFSEQPVGGDFENAKPLTELELAAWQRTLESRRDWLRAKGIPYLFVVAPDKQSVYPEYLPEVVRSRPTVSHLDQLVDHLRTHSDFALLDLRGPLVRAKAGAEVYYKLDTHWNRHGAFVGYREIVGRLRQWFPGLEARRAEDFRTLLGIDYPGDIADMMNLRGRFPVPDPVYCPKTPARSRPADPHFVDPRVSAVAFEIDDPSLPRAIVFRDSFGGHLAPFLTEHFRRIEFIGRNDFDPEIVAAERPDVVIQELVERHIAGAFSEDPPAVRERLRERGP